MAHYAFIDENNKVVDVIVGKDENDTETLPDSYSDWEQYYGEKRNLTCKRTSYNTLKNQHNNGGVAFRGNYAGIGWTYDSEKDAFVPPKPFDSWILNEDDLDWEAPVAHPNDNNSYDWNESTQSWDLVT